MSYTRSAHNQAYQLVLWRFNHRGTIYQSDGDKVETPTVHACTLGERWPCILTVSGEPTSTDPSLCIYKVDIAIIYTQTQLPFVGPYSYMEIIDTDPSFMF